MTTPTYTITTAKGSFTGTLREVCAWRDTNHEGAFPTVARDGDSDFGEGIDAFEANMGPDGKDMEISVKIADSEQTSEVLSAFVAEFGAPTLGNQDSGRVWFSWIVNV